MKGEPKRGSWIWVAILILPLLFLLIRMNVKDPIFFKEKEFDIVLKDQRTGAPIPGALVYLNWVKRIGGSFGGPGFEKIKEMWILSDRDGRIHVPEFKSTHIFSTFESFSAEIKHPLYERKSVGLYEAYVIPDETKDYEVTTTNGQKEVIINFLLLKDKYADAKCIATKVVGGFKLNCSGGGENLRFGIDEAHSYFSELDDHFNIVVGDKSLVPSKKESQKIWDYLTYSVFKLSAYKPDKDFKPYEIK